MDSQQNSTVFHRRSINNPFKLFKEIKRIEAEKIILISFYEDFKTNIKISKDTTKKGKYSPISLRNTDAKFLKTN